MEQHTTSTSWISTVSGSRSLFEKSEKSDSMLPIYLECDYYLSIADFAQQVVEQMHIDQFWRIWPQTPTVDSQHPFVRIGARMRCVRDPFEVEMRLEGALCEFVERNVRGVCRGVDEPQALQIAPIRLLQPLVTVLWEFH